MFGTTRESYYSGLAVRRPLAELLPAPHRRSVRGHLHSARSFVAAAEESTKGLLALLAIALIVFAALSEQSFKPLLDFINK
jgi:hypothetical protein